MNKLQVTNHAGQRVLTTAQLAEAYGAEPIKIQQNFANNRDRYTEGKHFFLLEGDELKAFKNNDLENFEVVNRINRLYLWTEKGAWLHAKSLNTDKAWDAYEMLVDEYYRILEARTALPQFPIPAPLAIMKAHIEAVDKLAVRLSKPAAAQFYAKVLEDANRDIAEKLGIQDYCTPYIEALVGKSPRRLTQSRQIAKPTEPIPDFFVDETGNKKLRGRLVSLVPKALRALWLKSGLSLRQLAERTGFTRRGVHNVLTRERHTYMSLHGLQLVLREFGLTLETFLPRVEELAGVAQ